MVDKLPEDFPAAILIVVHVPARYPSHLPQILGRRTPLDVAHALDGERIAPGTVRIAPPDVHLVVRDGHMRLTRTPSENRHRPSIDALFRTASHWYGDRLVAVVLSGGPGDGVDGVRAVEDAGGKVLVQDPQDALFGALPYSAMEVVEPAFTGTAHELGEWLAELREPDGSERRLRVMDQSPPRDRELTAQGWKPSVFACPDCTGVLWERDDGKLIRFRCRIGHFYGPDALVDGKSEELESARWSAINSMEERGELAQRLAMRAAKGGFTDTSERYQRTAEDMRQQAGQIRELVGSWSDPRLDGVPSPAEDVPEDALPA